MTMRFRKSTYYFGLRMQPSRAGIRKAATGAGFSLCPRTNHEGTHAYALHEIGQLTLRRLRIARRFRLWTRFRAIPPICDKRLR